MGNVVPFQTPLAVRLSDSKSAVPYGRQAPATSLLRQRHSRFNDISLARITGIIEDAKIGNTVEMADLCEHMVATDPHLFSVVESRNAPVAGARWTLDPPKGPDPKLAQSVTDHCHDMLEEIPDLEQNFGLLLNATNNGYQVLEIEWTTRKGIVVPSSLIWIPARNFRFDDQVNLYLYADGAAYHQADPEDRIDAGGAFGMRLAADKYVIHTPRALPAQIPASGLLQTVARYWWVKQWVMKFWVMGADLAGNPRAMAKYPNSATEEQIAELRRALEAFASDGVIATAEGVTVEIQAPLAQGSTSVWDRLLWVCDSGMSKAIIGSVANVDSQPNGSRSAAESQFDATTLPRAQRDGRALWSTIERYLFKPFLKFNADRYGGRIPATPRGKFILYEAPVAITELAVKTKSVRRNELRSSCGLTEWSKEEGGDDIVTLEEATQLGALPAPVAAPVATPAPQPEAPKDITPEEVPTETDVESGEVAKASDLGLNGAQIKELKQLIIDVAGGVLPRASALGIIRVAFPSVSPEAAAEMMPPEGFAPAAPVDPSAAAAPASAEKPLGGAAAALPLSERRKPWDLASRLAGTSDASLMSSRSPQTRKGI